MAEGWAERLLERKAPAQPMRQQRHEVVRLAGLLHAGVVWTDGCLGWGDSETSYLVLRRGKISDLSAKVSIFS